MRCFIAIDIPFLKNIDDFFNDVKKAGKIKMVKKENLHITLKFLGEINYDSCKNVIEKLSSIDFMKFNMKLSGCGAFPNLDSPKVIWIGISDGSHIKLMDEIDITLSSLNFKKSNKKPHLTIGRVKGKYDFQSIYSKWKDIDFGEVKIKKFILKKSTLTYNGAIHETISEYQLK